VSEDAAQTITDEDDDSFEIRLAFTGSECPECGESVEPGSCPHCGAAVSETNDHSQ
jgi:ribosomal protein S27AE